MAGASTSITPRGFDPVTPRTLNSPTRAQWQHNFRRMDEEQSSEMQRTFGPGTTRL